MNDKRPAECVKGAEKGIFKRFPWDSGAVPHKDTKSGPNPHKKSYKKRTKSAQKTI